MDGIIDKQRWIKTTLLIAAIVGAFVVVIFIASCIEVPTVVSCIPIDVKYAEAYDAVETMYEYKLNMWTLEYQLVPVVQTVHHEETWSILYQTTWSSGNQTTEWRTCTEEEYDRVKAESHISTTESYCYQCGDSMNGEDNYCRNCGLGLNPQTIYKCGKCIYESELECEVCPSCGCNVIIEITSGGGRIEKTK